MRRTVLRQSQTAPSRRCAAAQSRCDDRAATCRASALHNAMRRCLRRFARAGGVCASSSREAALLDRLRCRDGCAAAPRRRAVRAAAPAPASRPPRQAAPDAAAAAERRRAAAVRRRRRPRPRRRRRSIRCAPTCASTSTTRTRSVDLWERVRRGFAMPDLDGELVRKREQYYARRPDYVQRMTERGGRYLFHIVEEVRAARHADRAGAAAVHRERLQPAGDVDGAASGMWQFMPATGRDFELTQNVFRDDRRDVLASTRAALDYLQQPARHVRRLAPRAGRLQLGRRQRAARDRAQPEAGLPTDYVSLRMPSETRDYVPKLQAVKNIVARPERLRPRRCRALENHPYFLSVPIERDIDVELAARLAGMPLDEFQQLNPQMNRPVILAAGTPQVLLPYDNANAFVRDAAAAHAGRWPAGPRGSRRRR